MFITNFAFDWGIQVFMTFRPGQLNNRFIIKE